MKDILIHGLYLASFKGISNAGIKLAPLQKINLLVGPNNSGKSSILKFLSKYLHGKRQGSWARDYSPEDIPIGRSASEVRFGFGVPSTLLLQATSQLSTKKLINALAINEYIWTLISSEKPQNSLLDWNVTSAERLLSNYEWRDSWSALTKMSGGDMSHWVPATLQNIAAAAVPEPPKVMLIPAIRQISAGDELSDYSGSGLINELAKLQNPDFHNQAFRQRFKAIEQFVRTVTGEDDATIEVPYERTHLVVHMGGKVLPLSALGTGIHEIVMLAAFCTLAENEIVCLEEPEIHLHPLLQRKLIRYLYSQTHNQYFIATHSSAMLDAAPSAVFSVTQSQGSTHIRLASTPTDRFEICRALGYQASDLLQSNAVIWVEGPSDRIYLLHWIKSVAPDFVEGIDFSIMFYGGRLLSHLTATDDEVSEFISLRRLNRNIAIVIDSDRSAKGTRINATKKRIVDELSDGYVWVTAGREIENYIPASITREVLINIFGLEANQPGQAGPYDRALSYIDKKGKPQVADKIKFARAVVHKDADFGVMDLRKRITDLVAFIRRASGRHRNHHATIGNP